MSSTEADGAAPLLPDYADAVLTQVERVPEGNVVTYGDIAAVVGKGPRQVGAVMAQYGSLVCWWRVLHADGSAAPGLEDEARQHWLAEQVPMRGRLLDRVDLSRARWPLD